MLATKITGKPYAGKPHVRIDEGEGEYYVLLTLLYSTEPVDCTLKGFTSFDYAQDTRE